MHRMLLLTTGLLALAAPAQAQDEAGAVKDRVRAEAEDRDRRVRPTGTVEERVRAEAEDPQRRVRGGEAPAGEAPGEEDDGAMPPPEYGYFTTTLDNGLKVSVLSDPDHPVVATQTWVAVGSAHEADSEAGFAHLFEHFMFGDTSTYGKDVYSLHHTRHGGTENAYTAFDNTVYISEIPPSYHPFVLELEADRLVNLVLDQDNLDNEKKIVTEELRLRTENNPFGRLLISALAGLFGEHPYGHSPAGTKEDIQAADLELARKFYEGYYRPANLHLVVVGPVNGPWTLERIEALYGGLPAEHAEPPAVPELSDWNFPERVELKDDIPPIKVAANVYIAPSATSEDYWAMKVLGQMLSGGAVDRFREELVGRRGKALDASGMYVDQFKAGGLVVFGSVSLPWRSKRRALRLVDQSIEALDQGDWLTQENLEIARRALLRDELQGRYYAASQADDIGRAWAYMGDDQLGVDGFAEHIAAVTLADVQSVWTRYIAGAQPVEFFVKKGKPE